MRKRSRHSMTASSSRRPCLRRQVSIARWKSSEKLICFMAAGDRRCGWNYEVANGVNFLVEPTLPHDESLTIQKGEVRVFLCLGDRELRLVEAEDKPVLKFRHGDFSAAKLAEHT